MNSTQAKILELARHHDLGSLSLREIAKRVGKTHPQSVKYHLNQLAQRGLIVMQKRNQVIHPISVGSRQAEGLTAIPIMGAANCGDARVFADERLEGYLRVSSNILKHRGKNLFAVKATGDSMDDARGIPGGPIDDGDYVVIDNDDRTAEDGDYVLSIVDGCANIKKFRNDPEQERIILSSESSKDYPPIIIHVDDYTDIGSYMVNGKVVQVIKKPNF